VVWAAIVRITNFVKSNLASLWDQVIKATPCALPNRGDHGAVLLRLAEKLSLTKRAEALEGFLAVPIIPEPGKMRFAPTGSNLWYVPIVWLAVG
jgi:hypothetical protein